MDLENRIVEKITNHPSIDTSPSYSPDGKYICLTRQVVSADLYNEK